MQTTIDHTGNYVTKDEPPVPTLTQRAVAELSEFNSQIASLQPYGDLTVAADGIGKVEEAHKAVKRLNAAIEKKRKELKAGALEYGRTVDSIAKQLSSAVDAIEGKLGAERERYEAEREAERKAKEAEKQAVIQARIDQCAAEFIPVSLEKVSLPEDEFLWWFATEKRRVIAEKRLAQLAKLGVNYQGTSITDYSDAEWLKFIEPIERDLAARIEEERRQAEQFAEQQRAEREALAAKLKAEQEELRAEREKIAAEREELRQAQMREQREREAREAELLEKRRAEERKRREDAAKPELERLEGVVTACKERITDCLSVSMPWWAPEFVTRFGQFAQMMEDFVREGSEQ